MFNVSYEIVTHESALIGDTAENGFVVEDVRLRDALEALCSTRTSQCDGVIEIETSNRFFTVYNGMEFLTGAYENRSLHMPKNITESSRKRIANLIQNM